MTDIKLDPKKLLGFKIGANGESTATLRSPKIGSKNCTVLTNDVALGLQRSPIGAKIGFKTS